MGIVEKSLLSYICFAKAVTVELSQEGLNIDCTEWVAKNVAQEGAHVSLQRVPLL